MRLSTPYSVKDYMENMRRDICFAIKENLFMTVSKEAQYESGRARAVSKVIEQARGVIKKEKDVKNLMMK
jgi:hypothetical protein